MSVTEKLNGYGPLNGVKVVELCEWVAAPATVRVLSEMGAEIIKVEPLHGDAQRTQGPGFGCEQTDREDPTIDLNNTNKNWLALNLKTPEGSKVMHQLLATADVFVNNLRDKALVKLGFDYATLKEKYPTLLWAQMRGYGECGPERDTPGFDAVCWAARGGVANVFREDGESPAIPPQAFGDYNAASILSGGILAALFNRTRTGKGDKVTCNLYGAAIWGGNIGVMATQFGAPYPKSRKHVPNPFNNTYKTKDDKWMLICMPQYDKYDNMMMEITGNAARISPTPATCPRSRRPASSPRSSAGSRRRSPPRRSRNGTRSCASTRCPTRSASATPTSSRTKRPTTTTPCAGLNTKRSARRPSP